jgi:hypothetical protein
MKKNSTITTLVFFTVIGFLSSCSKKSQGEILPPPSNDGFVVNTTTLVDTPYGYLNTLYGKDVLSDTPYGKKPIKIIPAIWVDTPYGK